jgi:Domain of unknown function (DUF4082)/Alginate lyase
MTFPPQRRVSRTGLILGFALAVAVAAAVPLLAHPAQAATASGFWASSVTPKVSSSSDSEAIEVGLGFHSTIAGTVSGVRFFKGSKNTGTHLGSLWTKSGTELARVTFTGETATGWQQASFATPVRIAAATTYVIGYYAPKGHYADDTGYFTTQLHVGYLIAQVADTGMYLHGSGPRFPMNHHAGHNYWVDPVFAAGTPAPTSTAPTTPAPTSTAPTTPAPTSTAPTTPAPTSTAPTTPAPTSTAPGGAGVPAKVLDLTNWKLTLPVALGGSSSAAEIAQPQLGNYSLSPYFQVNTAGDGVVFQANAGGVTSSGSGYPRSELREMTNSGQSEASWSSASGTHRMTVVEASTHLPAVKPQVVTAQIHDASDDVVEIVADGTRSQASGAYSICVRYNGATQTPCMDSNYVSGTRYTIDLITGAGHIKVDYNGVQKFDFADSLGGLYFKAGAYTQSSPAKGDLPSAYGQVVIYGLQVTSGN